MTQERWPNHDTYIAHMGTRVCGHLSAHSTFASTQINATTFIQVINKNEAPVVTGFHGIDSHINPFLIAAGVVAAIGGAWLGIMAKRRRQMSEE